MADKNDNEETDPVLLAAKSGHLGSDMGRIVCMTHASSRRLKQGLEDFDDDAGGAPTVGAWKRGRSS
jgi:hypothetical protein